MVSISQGMASRWLCHMILSLAFVSLALPAHADTELRWKFKEGEKTKYEMTMAMTQEMKEGDMTVQIKMSQVMDMTWEVTKVDDQGIATLHQTIDRVRMEMAFPTPGQPPLKYDSQQPGGRPGTEILAKMFDAMVGKPFVVEVTALGEVKSMKPPAGLLAAFKNSPLQGTGVFSEEGLNQMISQSVMTLPEKAVTEGETWEKTSSTETPPFGKQVTKTEYKFAGQEDHDGRKLDKIDVTLDAKFELKEDSQTKVKLIQNEAAGSVFWDNAAGWLVESMMESSMKCEISVGGKSVEQGVTTKVSMKQVGADRVRDL